MQPGPQTKLKGCQGSKPAIPVQGNMPLILVLAAMDTTAFFHELAQVSKFYKRLPLVGCRVGRPRQRTLPQLPGLHPSARCQCHLPQNPVRSPAVSGKFHGGGRLTICACHASARLPLVLCAGRGRPLQRPHSDAGGGADSWEERERLGLREAPGVHGVGGGDLGWVGGWVGGRLGGWVAGWVGGRAPPAAALTCFWPRSLAAAQQHIYLFLGRACIDALARPAALAATY